MLISFANFFPKYYKSFKELEGKRLQAKNKYFTEIEMYRLAGFSID